MRPRETNKMTDTHIAEAAEWRLIGLLLERPRPGWHDEVAALAEEVGNAQLRTVATGARAATEGGYLRLLGPGGMISPRAVTYRAFEDPGRILADLAGFYGAFAFQPGAEEPIDHIAVATGFVSYLLLKEGFAEARGDIESAETTATARQRFVETHLAPMVHSFVSRLEVAGAGYLLDCGRLLASKVPAAPSGAATLPAADADEIPICGAGSSCNLR